MDEQTLKRLLGEALDPLKKDLVEVKKTQDEMKGAIDEIKDTQDNRVLPSVTATELTLKSYSDSYKINRHNIERLDDRLTTAEDQLGITPPEHLKVPHFSGKS
jgi:hypothetical protein